MGGWGGDTSAVARVEGRECLQKTRTGVRREGTQRRQKDRYATRRLKKKAQDRYPKRRHKKQAKKDR